MTQSPGFVWTPHQFVGGALCLDLVNTVIFPTDPARRRDRLADPGDLLRWANTALAHAAETLARRAPLTAAEVSPARFRQALNLRAAIDATYRPLAGGGGLAQPAFPWLARGYADAVAAVHFAPGAGGIDPQPADPTQPVPLLALLAHSAMRLALSPASGRLGVCVNCGWLFVDRSRARRRRWCDMRVCGNRAKARRHHQRRRAA